MSDLVYPHIEISLANGEVAISLVTESSRKLLTEQALYSDAINTAKNQLTKLDAESEAYADDAEITFIPGEGLDFAPLQKQLTQKLETYKAANTDPQIAEVLAANFQADLFLGFKRAVAFQVLAAALGLAGDNGTVENFVLTGGDNFVIESISKDLETLGYDLQVV